MSIALRSEAICAIRSASASEPIALDAVGRQGLARAHRAAAGLDDRYRRCLWIASATASGTR